MNTFVGRCIFVALLYYVFFSATDFALKAPKNILEFTKNQMKQKKIYGSDSSSDSSSSDSTKKRLRRWFENLGERP